MKNTFGYSTNEDAQLALLHFKKIGNRHVEAAKKNAPRLNMEKIKIANSGYTGPGAHYLNIVNNSEVKADKKNIKKVIDSSGNILLQDFPRSTGELGVYVNPRKGILLASDDLRELLKIMKEIDKDSPLYEILKRMLIQIRPNHPILSR